MVLASGLFAVLVTWEVHGLIHANEDYYKLDESAGLPGLNSSKPPIQEPMWQPKECKDIKAVQMVAIGYQIKLAAIVKNLAQISRGEDVCAGVKFGPRVSEKVHALDRTYMKSDEYTYDKDCARGGKPHTCINDFVRCSIVYNDASVMNTAIPKLAEALKTMEKTNVSAAQFVRADNRMKKIGDFITKIGMIGGSRNTCGYYHVGELQLHVKPVIAAKEGASKAKTYGYENLVTKHFFDKGAINAALTLTGEEQQMFTNANETIPDKFTCGHEIYEVQRSLAASKKDLIDMLIQKGNNLYTAALQEAGYGKVNATLGNYGPDDFNVYKPE